MAQEKLYSWFLGPKAENADLLEQLVLEAVRDCVFWRRNFHPEDAMVIPEQTKQHPEFQGAVATLRQEFWELLAGLKRDVPFFSPRYIGHMLGDQLLPAILGYFAAMLHNPNNVSPEAAPITTEYELEIARQLGELMGWTSPLWGHITSGGTVANFEALWIARNLKYFPWAAREAARAFGFHDLTFVTPTGERRVLVDEEDPWPLLNLDTDAILDLRAALYTAYIDAHGDNGSDEELWRFSLSSRGAQRFFADEVWRDIQPGVILVPATAHYSLGKIAEALGVGKEQLECVPVDERFRMDVTALRHRLEECAASRTPVITVVSVMGSTEEGAVDPLHRVVELREAMRVRGLTFSLHADAAWGGYVRTLFYDKENKPVQRADDITRLVRYWPTEDVFQSFSSIHHADSVTIDPHKLGYIPYPSGVIVFKRDRVKEFIAFEAPYIVPEQRHEEDICLGQYIFEGSKPGAAAASCWLAHRVVPLNHDGYGLLVGKSIEGAQELHFQCKEELIPILEREGVILQLLTQPPDLNLLCFLVNDRGNHSLREMNRLNQEIYRALRFNPDEVLQTHKFMISKTDFLAKQYGRANSQGVHSMAGHLQALGIAPDALGEVGRVTVLRVSIIAPWLALTQGARTPYIREFVEVLREEIHNGVKTVKGR